MNIVMNFVGMCPAVPGPSPGQAERHATTADSWDGPIAQARGAEASWTSEDTRWTSAGFR